jgi:hypothetical protein
MLAVPRLCELYPGIFLTTDEIARKNLGFGSSTYITSRHSTMQNNEQHNTQKYNTKQGSNAGTF